MNTTKHTKAKNEAILWARNVLNNKDNWVILDTETTGFTKAEILQIAICDLDGNTILNSLVKPTKQINADAIAVHGITQDTVKNAPTFSQIYPKLANAISNKQVLIYNADYDLQVIEYCEMLHGIKQLDTLDIRENSDCLMLWYAQYYGQWHDYYQSYTWQPLRGDHSALGDCLATLSRLKTMASDKLVNLDKYYKCIEKCS